MSLRSYWISTSRAEHLVPGDLHALLQEEQHPVVGLGRAEAIDAGDAGHDDDVAAVQQGVGGRMAQLVDLFVDGGILLDVGIRARDVGFGLVVIVVADEILDGVVREKVLEFPVELGGQGLVVGDDQGGPLDGLNHVGHGEGLAGTGNAEEDLVSSHFDALGESQWPLAGRPSGSNSVTIRNYS